MADTSLIIGNENWAVKETSLLGYNIIQSKYVPIEMTVSRNTTATRVNSAGLIELGPKNLFSYSQTFDTAGWSPYPAGASTVIPNVLATSAPNGTFTADKLVANAVAGDHWLLQSATISFSLAQVTVSVFAKKAGLSNIQLYNNAGGGGEGNFDLNAGTWTGDGTSMQDYGNGWYRCIMTYILPSVPNFNIHIRLANSSGSTSFTGNGVDGVYLWGAQLEQGTTATEYFPTTDRFNVPRVDYSTGTASLLVEPTRTNLVPDGLLFNVAPGVSYDTAVIDSPAIGINSARITKNEASGNIRFAQQNGSNAALSGSTTYTFSRYFKYDGTNITTSMQFNTNAPWGGTAWNQQINIASTGVTLGTSTSCTSTIRNAGNGWYRVNVTIVTGAAPIGSPQDLMILNSSLSTGQGFLTALPQLEVGSNSTSYIPTTTTTPSAGVTRTADVISKTGISSLIGQTEGTIFVEANLTANAADRRIIVVSDGTEAQRIMFWTFGTTLYANFNTILVTIGTFPIGTAKMALAYTIAGGSTTYSIKLNNNTLITGTAAAAPTPLSAIHLGTNTNSVLQLNDRIKSVQLYKTALSPGQLATLTAII